MTDSARIYFDNAATSWPKPPEVLDAFRSFYETNGSSAGRGSGRHAIAAKEIVESTRTLVADFIGARSAKNVIFTSNGTASLNQAILGLLKQGDHVVTTQAEHNSVLRVLKHLENKKVITVERVPVDAVGRCSANDIATAINDETRLIITTHASNVTGAIQPVKEIGKIAREREVVFLLDAAQTLGHFPVDVNDIGCSLMASPGHKGLLGPLGTGLLYIDSEIADEITPTFFGGTGSESDSDEQPQEMPTRFESGNLNVAAIAGLKAGLEFIGSESGEKLVTGMNEFKSRLAKELADIEGITVYGSEDDRIGLFSITVDGVDSRDASAMLESSYSIETRAGFHCAPLIHSALGTEALGGTVRISLGVFNSEQEVSTLLDAIKQIAAANIF